MNKQPNPSIKRDAALARIATYVKRWAFFFLAVGLLLCGIGSSAVAAAPKRTKQAAEVNINESYASARSKLLRHGWLIDREWGVSGIHEKLTYAQYPEVLCGEGYNAVCTGRFKKGDVAILLTINQFKKHLPVEFISND